jgi:hypothetical protein
MIYVIRTKSEPSYLKIGYSETATRERMRKMQTGCPFELEMIMAREGSKEEEKELHVLLKKFHFRGEWFHSNKQSLKLLGLLENPTPIKLKTDEVAPGMTVHDWHVKNRAHILLKTPEKREPLRLA